MKKEKKELGKIKDIFIDIEAIASTSSFERKIDSRLETLARCIKNAIPIEVSDKLDDIKSKRNKLFEKYKKEAFGKPKPEFEFQKLLMSDTYLSDARKEEEDLWKIETDFEFKPVYMSEVQLDEAYENLPQEDATYEGERVEFKGDFFTVKRLRKKLRKLVDDGFIIIGEEKQEEAAKTGRNKK